MKIFFTPLCLTALLLPACGDAAPNISECRVGDYNQEQILALKATDYKDLGQIEVNQIALDLVACLGHPDPEIRDGLVYESYSALLRADRIDDATKTLVLQKILPLLNGPDDENGFSRPFAALDISELARADRIAPYLTDTQRGELVDETSKYLSSLDDYRGFVDQEGWRHGAAHASDIALQLTLNPQITDEQIAQMRTAVRAQIAPAGNHAYIHGEPQRLARPILFMARRGTFSIEDWQAWIEDLAKPDPFEQWGDVYKSEEGLAKLHNTKAFLSILYLNARESQNENITALLPSVRAALIALP